MIAPHDGLDTTAKRAPNMSIPQQDLISQYNTVHEQKASWGKSAHKHLMSIQACIAELKPGAIVEYGCGKSTLYKTLDYKQATYTRFDPAIPGIDTLDIKQADFAINTDVLEHIPLQELPTVLSKIRSLTDKVYFYVCTRPASLILPNGENAHCTLMSAEKWLDLIKQHFSQAQIVHIDRSEGCVIITWDSLLPKVLSGLEEYKITDKKYRVITRPWYKKLEKLIRTLRDKILGRKKYRRS